MIYFVFDWFLSQLMVIVEFDQKKIVHYLMEFVEYQSMMIQVEGNFDELDLNFEKKCFFVK